MRNSHRGFAPLFILVIIGLIIVGGSIYYFKQPKQEAIPLTTSIPHHVDGWKIFSTTTHNFTFEYPAYYGSPSELNYSWSDTGIEVHLTSEHKKDIHIIEESDDKNYCFHALCLEKAQKKITHNAIIWDYLGKQKYCDAGHCGTEQEVYKTTYGKNRYYLILENEDQAETILSTFVFTNIKE
ncbi:MAG: hypothetical protein K0S38_510 [Candidatus Paceibacter sp.]|jgi:hypothetical protein|nr:hypothetical protein [Candidatus Paceibacter sp.]